MTECPCPACGFLTTGELWFGTYNICEVCGWKDDHVQLANPGSGGGANQRSLIETQQRLLRDISQEIIRLGRFVRDVKWRPLRPSEIESALLDTKKDVWMHTGVDRYEQSY